MKFLITPSRHNSSFSLPVFPSFLSSSPSLSSSYFSFPLSCFCFYFCGCCSTSHRACLQTLLLCCHGDAAPDGECQGKERAPNALLSPHTFIHTVNRPRLWQRTFCSTLTSYSDAAGSALCPLCTHTHTPRRTLTHTHTHTHILRYSTIKPVSLPHRKQSPLYVTGMSLILAEVNNCTCVEGIFHSRGGRQRSPLWRCALRSLRSCRAGSGSATCVRGCFIPQMNVCPLQREKETWGKK